MVYGKYSVWIAIICMCANVVCMSASFFCEYRLMCVCMCVCVWGGGECVISVYIVRHQCAV